MFTLTQNFLKEIFLFVGLLGIGFPSYSQNAQRPQDPCPSGQQQIGKFDPSTTVCAGNSKIQVGAFGDFNNAKNFVNKMRSQGFDATLDPGIEGQLNKVLISVNGKTGFSDDSAKTIGSRLAQAGIKYSVVIDRGSDNFLIGSCSADLDQPPEWRCNVKKFLEIRKSKNNPYMTGGFFYFGENSETGIFYGINTSNPAEPIRFVRPLKYEIIEKNKKIKVIVNIDGCFSEKIWEKDGNKYFYTEVKYYGDCSPKQVELNNRMIRTGKTEKLIFSNRPPP